MRQVRKKSARKRPNPYLWSTIKNNTKSRFIIAKNYPVRPSKYNPAVVWSKCFACNKDLWTNRMTIDIFDMYNQEKKFTVCNNQKCINLLIFQEL